MADAANLDAVGIGADEEQPVVANAQPKFFSSFESFHVAHAPIPQSDVTRRECAWRWACSGCGHRSGLGRSKQSASLRFFEFEVIDFFLGKPEFSQDLLVRNALVMLPSFARFRERLFFLRCNWFIVKRSVRDGTGHGVEHGLKQADDGGELRRRKPVDQFMGLLFLVRGTVCHKKEFSEIRCTVLGIADPTRPSAAPHARSC
jgi:hypothetical protein